MTDGGVTPTVPPKRDLVVVKAAIRHRIVLAVVVSLASPPRTCRLSSASPPACPSLSALAFVAATAAVFSLLLPAWHVACSCALRGTRPVPSVVSALLCSCHRVPVQLPVPQPRRRVSLVLPRQPMLGNVPLFCYSGDEPPLALSLRLLHSNLMCCVPRSTCM